jgi:hypothetical protein
MAHSLLTIIIYKNNMLWIKPAGINYFYSNSYDSSSDWTYANHSFTAKPDPTPSLSPSKK